MREEEVVQGAAIIRMKDGEIKSRFRLRDHAGGTWYQGTMAASQPPPPACPTLPHSLTRFSETAGGRPTCESCPSWRHPGTKARGSGVDLPSMLWLTYVTHFGVSETVSQIPAQCKNLFLFFSFHLCGGKVRAVRHTIRVPGNALASVGDPERHLLHAWTLPVSLPRPYGRLPRPPHKHLPRSRRLGPAGGTGVGKVIQTKHV